MIVVPEFGHYVVLHSFINTELLPLLKCIHLGKTALTIFPDVVYALLFDKPFDSIYLFLHDLPRRYVQEKVTKFYLLRPIILNINII